MAIQNNKRVLNKKERQMMNPFVAASIDGLFITKDPKGSRRTAMICNATTSQYLYCTEEDGYVLLPSMALGGTFGAGACGTWGLRSIPVTANGGSTTSVTTTTAIKDYVGEDFKIRFLTGANAGLESAISSIKVVAGGTNTINFAALPNAAANGDTFIINSGRYYIMNAGTIASGIFKSFDMLTYTTQTLQHTGLPATWGTSGRLVSTPSYVGAFATGTATAGGASTLTNSAKAWTTNQWANYQIRITAGTGIGQIRTIASNTGTVITVSVAWTTQPDNTSVYAIEGNDDYIYLLGNGAVTMYRYSISANTWTTLSPTAARAAAPGAGMGANRVGKTNNTFRADENDIKDGRYIYSFRGTATGALHRYDIALNTWATIAYLGERATFTTGSAYDVDDNLIFIRQSGSNIFYYYDVCGNYIRPFSTNLFTESTAREGDKIFTVQYSGGIGNDTIKRLYSLGNNTTALHRIMIY